MAKIKYLVCPNIVTSKSDGDRHYVGARKLIELYKVHPDECIVALDYREKERILRHSPHLKVLEPRYNGNYELKDLEDKYKGE